MQINGDLWFSSDHHFYHNNVIGFCNRPFYNVEHMNKELIRRHNSRVRPQDTCIIVGDFSFGNAQQTKEIVDQLNGTLILIEGNHDKKGTINKFHASFREATIAIAGYTVSIKHYPLKWPRFSHLKERFVRFIKKVPDPRYLDRHPVDKGQLHIHGHTHSPVKFHHNQIHVGVDAWDYYPVSVKKISKYIQQFKEKY